MTASRLAALGAARLAAAGKENGANEARWLAREAFSLSAEQIAAGAEPDAAGEARFESFIQRRLAGTPLQYILGTAFFGDIEVKVGPGVLIPRPETLLLARTAAEAAAGGGEVYDLCAGSGCVSLWLSRALPDCGIWAAEYSDEALRWLRLNVSGCPNVTAVKADLLTDRLPGLPRARVIAANPPYLTRAELGAAPEELAREPAAALDGGEDGLKFYRPIALTAREKLEPGGTLAFECGAGQAEDVCRICLGLGFRGPRVLRDFSGIERVCVFSA